MTDLQWEELCNIVVGGTTPEPPACGFIIDSPWLPNWAGISMLDYYVNDELWFGANKRAIEEFPTCMFLPGFWPEYGMSLRIPISSDCSPISILPSDSSTTTRRARLQHRISVVWE